MKYIITAGLVALIVIIAAIVALPLVGGQLIENVKADQAATKADDKADAQTQVTAADKAKAETEVKAKEILAELDAIEKAKPAPTKAREVRTPDFLKNVRVWRWEEYSYRSHLRTEEYMYEDAANGEAIAISDAGIRRYIVDLAAGGETMSIMGPTGLLAQLRLVKGRYLGISENGEYMITITRIRTE